MNKYYINTSDFESKGLIGRGQYGNVYKYLKKSTNVEYAAKILIFPENEEDQKKLINREIKIMSNLVHPTLVKLIGFSVKNTDSNYQIEIIMEMASNGSLKSILNECNNTERQIILVGVARGMMFLHQNKVIHFDLKPENILIDKDLKPHISDFGFSRFMKMDKIQLSKSFSCCGTPMYMAPEVIREDDIINTKADVYSFGIIMFEVVTGKKAYPNLTVFNLLDKVSEENYRPEFPADFKNECLKKLICQCWDQDPEKRPTFEEIFNKLAYNQSKNFDVFESDMEDENHSYYLDGVDVEKVQKYAYEIVHDDDDQLNIDIALIHKRLEQIEKILIHYLSKGKSEDDVFNFLKLIEIILSSPNNFYDLASKIDELKGYIDGLKQEFEGLNLLQKIKELELENEKVKDMMRKLEENTQQEQERFREEIRNSVNQFLQKIQKIDSLESKISGIKN